MSSNTNIRKIGAKIKELRALKNLSQAELAKDICSKSTISQLEVGSYPSMPSGEILKGLAKKLGASIGALMAGVEKDELESSIVLDIAKVSVHRREFQYSLALINELKNRDDLPPNLQHELTICHADCLTKMGKAKQAIDLLSALLEKLEEEQETDRHLLAELNNKLGNAWYFESNMLNAHSSYHRAYQLSLHFPDSDLLKAFIVYNYGLVCRWLRRDNLAVELLEGAKIMFEKLSNRRDMADIYFELGIAYKNIQALEQAASYMQKSLHLYESLEISDMIHRTNHQYAFYILAATDPIQAINKLQESVEFFEKTKDTTNLAYTIARIAFLYLNSSNVESAGIQLKTALDLFTEEEAEQEPKFAYILRVHAKYLLMINELDKSLEFSFKSARILDRMGLQKEMAESLELAAEAYELQGKVFESNELNKKVIQIYKDSLAFFAIP